MSQAPHDALYSGYHHRPKAAVANPLTQTAPGTDGGEYLRRYWHPIALSSEVGTLPKAIRILSEDLVLFRERGGKLGLLHRQCIHRGASLEFGIPQERGIMCCYHGWVFDTTGAVLSVGAEPETSRIPANFGQGAYPVRELHGMIFAYMGPPESMPEFPIYDTFLHPADNELVPLKLTIPCNWLQIVENACDPIHNAYLHAIVSGEQFSAAFKVQPALDFVETPMGFLSMATRHVKDKVYIRASDIMLPNVAQFAAGSNDASLECFNISCGLTRWVVPIDDEHSLYIGYGHYNARTEQFRRAPAEELGVDRMGFIGQTADRPYEERQMEPGDYDALVSQGSIANHQAEHLGTTDRGIVMFRRMLGRAIEAVRTGEIPAKPRVYADGPVRTYNHEVVMTLPSQANVGKQALADFGRRAAQIVIDTDTLPPLERETVARQRVADLMTGSLVA